MKLQNRKVLITGASKGFGLAVADSLASEGAKLFLTARDDKALKKICVELSDRGADIAFATADFNNPSALSNLFAEALDFLGGLDVLINNAGLGIKKPVADLSASEWDLMFNVNLKAVYILSKLAAAKMIHQKSGHIINIGSGASQTPIANFAAYCASKYGLLGFSESLALELREHNIKVSIILPGSTATHFGGSLPESKLTAQPGLLLPQDIADSVAFLLKQGAGAWTSVMNLRPLHPDKR